jgi:hypothetical protein
MLQRAIRRHLAGEELLEEADFVALLTLVTELTDACLGAGDIDQNLHLAGHFVERAKLTVINRLSDTSFKGCHQLTVADGMAISNLVGNARTISQGIRRVRIHRGLKVSNGPGRTKS